MSEAKQELSPPTRRRRRKSVDLTAAFGFPFSDKDWLLTLLLHGLLLLLPIFGNIVVMGWQRRAFDRIKKGEEGLPSISDLGKSLSEGVAPFVAILNAVIPMAIFSVVVMLVAMGSLIGSIIIAEETNEEIVVVFGILIALVAYGGLIIAAIVMMIIMPELRRRGFRGEMFPLLTPGVSIAAWKKQPVGYLVVCVGFVLTSMLGGIGVYLCYVGMFVTMPWAHAANASLLAQFDLLLDDSPPSPEEEPSSADTDSSAQEESDEDAPTAADTEAEQTSNETETAAASDPEEPSETTDV